MSRQNHHILSTRDRIINATLNVIAAEGFQKVTIRKITEIADVNVAAVNYHFGSKDSVISEAIKTITVQMEEAFSCLKSADLDPEAKIECFIRQYSRVVREYPDIVRHFISQSLQNNLIKVEYQEYLKAEGFELISRTIGELTPGEDRAAINMRALQLISSLSFPILIGDRIKEVAGLDLDNPEVRNRYTELLVKNVTGLDSKRS